MKVTGRVQVDLRGRLTDEEMARRISVVAEMPAGSTVELLVGRKRWPDLTVVWRLRELGSQLQVVIVAASPDVVLSWRRQLLDEPEPDPWATDYLARDLAAAQGRPA